MDQSLNYYQNCIKERLRAYETIRTEHSKVELIFDDEQGHYMAVRIGWFNQRYTHLCLVHIGLCNGQVIIHCNNTEDLIATELSEMRIPKHKIILGFIPPEVRMLSNNVRDYYTL